MATIYHLQSSRGGLVRKDVNSHSVEEAVLNGRWIESRLGPRFIYIRLNLWIKRRYRPAVCIRSTDVWYFILWKTTTFRHASGFCPPIRYMYYVSNKCDPAPCYLNSRETLFLVFWAINIIVQSGIWTQDLSDMDSLFEFENTGVLDHPATIAGLILNLTSTNFFL